VGVLWIDAATYLASFLLVATLVPAQDRAGRIESRGEGMLAGVRYCVATTWLPRSLG